MRPVSPSSDTSYDGDVPLKDILPAPRQANVGAFVLPFAGPRQAHACRCFSRWPRADDRLLVAGGIDPLTNIIAREGRRSDTRACGRGPGGRGRGAGQAQDPARGRRHRERAAVSLDFFEGCGAARGGREGRFRAQVSL